MAIDTHCPYCHKSYRLKDDLAGKKVTCANQDCRKAFTVTASANGSAKAAAPPKPAPAKPAAAKPASATPQAAKEPLPPPPDAEALAAAAFSEEGEDKGPEDTRTIEITCTSCDHKWAVPWAMQGKNALCPECRTRVKVPVQKEAKKADWRDRRQPSMAKVERLEGVVASQDNTFISGQTIKEAGLAEPEYEPRPITFWLKIGLVPVALIAAIATFVVFKMKSRQDRKEDNLVIDFRKAIDSDEIKSLPPEEAPLYRSLLLISAGEHEARKNEQTHRDQALHDFEAALAELSKAKRTAGRDVLFGELAVAVLSLGGDEGQVREKQRLPWVPAPPKLSKAKIKASPGEEGGVQKLLRVVLEAMKQEPFPVEYDVRAATARRVTRELIRKQVPVLLDTIPFGFAEPEHAEIRGQIGLELYRAGLKDDARKIAEEWSKKGEALTAANPTPASMQALFLAVEPPITSPSIASKPTGGNTSDAARMAFVELAVVQDKPDDAVAIMKIDGKSEGRLKALAFAAEWAKSPAPFIEQAADLTERETKKQPADRSLPSSQVLARLGVAAARAGLGDKVAVFTKPMLDEGLREWTKAEALRVQLAATPSQEAKEEQAELPPDSKKFHVGHAWARLQIARHNALRTGDRGLAQKYQLAWPTNTIAPFGQAGVALGIQDGESK